MLRRLKITVYDIVSTPPKVPKGPLDHYLHVLARAVGLYHLLIPLLLRRTKDPFRSFTPPPLYTTLITPRNHSPFLRPFAFMSYIPSKPSIGVLLGKKGSSLILLVLYAICL